MKKNSEIKKTAWSVVRSDSGRSIKAGLTAILLGGVSLFSFMMLQLVMLCQSRLLKLGAYGEAFDAMRYVYFGMIAYLIISIAVGSFVELGFDRFFLLLLRQEQANVHTLFYCRPVFMNAIMLRLLMGAKTLLWSVLFIVPGFVAMLNYSLAPYLVAQNPDITPPVAVYTSKILMRGYKGRLFRLLLSFAVEIIISILSFGIGFVITIPYMKAATAEFYRERVAEHDREVMRLKAESAAAGEADEDDED